MKKILLTMMLFFTLAQSANAGDLWNAKEKTLFASWVAVHFLDWGQTRNISQSPDYYELNPVLGRYPSLGAVNNYFVATAVLNYFLVDMLPRNMRMSWLTTNIVSSAGAVAHNNYIGIQLSF